MDILTRLVIFLIRIKLHLRKGEQFQFDNQKTDSVYWFTESALMKMERGFRYESSVSLNWLLNPECQTRAPYKALDIYDKLNALKMDTEGEQNGS